MKELTVKKSSEVTNLFELGALLLDSRPAVKESAENGGSGASQHKQQTCMQKSIRPEFSEFQKGQNFRHAPLNNRWAALDPLKGLFSFHAFS